MFTCRLYVDFVTQLQLSYAQNSLKICKLAICCLICSLQEDIQDLTDIIREMTSSSPFDRPQVAHIVKKCRLRLGDLKPPHVVGKVVRQAVRRNSNVSRLAVYTVRDKHTCTMLCVCVHAHMHTHTHARTHTHTHARTHTHTHTCIVFDMYPFYNRNHFQVSCHQVILA